MSGSFFLGTVESGLGPSSKPSTGFGTSWFDLNNDGWLDLLIANGAVTALEGAREGDVYHPYRERNQLFLNLGNGRFVEVGTKAGTVFALEEVSRGAAFGDLDNDGDVDVVMTQNTGPARLLVNRLGDRAHWLGLRLRRGDPPTDALDARIAVTVAGRETLWRRASSAASYCSANDSRVVVGLGEANHVERVRVEWPGGEVEEWADVPVDAWTDLTRGSGTPAR